MASNTNYFAMIDDENEFVMWQGLRGPYFQPHVAEDGTLSWTNNGGLPNPDPVRIEGTDGKSAYEAAVEAGYTGTEEEFNATLSNIGDVEEALNNKAGSLIETASGTVATFIPDRTITDANIDVSVDIKPVQNLHGYDSPWPAGGGKNLIVPRLPSITVNGISMTNNGDGSFTFVGTATASASFRIDQTSNTGIGNLNDYVRPFTISLRSEASVGRFTVLQVGSTLNLSCGVNSSATASADISGAFASIIFASGDTVNDTFYPQIESGSTATAWNPYSNICPISGWDAVEVERTGKNLLDDSKRCVVSSGTTVYIGATSSEYVIPLVAGEYTVSADTSGEAYGMYYRGETDTANTSIWAAGSGTTQKTITISKTGLYRFLVYRATSSGGVDNSKIVWVQVERGSTAIAYHPYAGNRYTIALGQTVYSGTLDVTNGTLTVDRAAVDMGTLSWVQDSSGAFYVIQSNKKRASLNILCSTLATLETPFFLSQYANYPDNIVGGNNSPSNNCFYVKATAYPTASAFISAMTGEKIVYEIETPIVIQLDPVTIATIAGQTNNVWADAGDVSVTYAADLKHYIDQKIAAAVAALS